MASLSSPAFVHRRIARDFRTYNAPPPAVIPEDARCKPPFTIEPSSRWDRRIRTGELSAAAITEHFLDRIDALDPSLGAFTVTCRDRALAQARVADVQLGAGIDLGPLHGIPYVAKDLYDVAGLPTTAGTRLLAGNVPAADCTVIDRLTRAGMVLLGKTITVQFAYGGAGINTDHGTPPQPLASRAPPARRIELGHRRRGGGGTGPDGAGLRYRGVGPDPREHVRGHRPQDHSGAGEPRRHLSAEQSLDSAGPLTPRRGRCRDRLRGDAGPRTPPIPPLAASPRTT